MYQSSDGRLKFLFAHHDAAEAWRAHNPQVPGSKPGDEMLFLFGAEDSKKVSETGNCEWVNLGYYWCALAVMNHVVCLFDDRRIASFV